MKKLLFLPIFLLLFSKGMQAQEKTLANHFSIVAGPNVFLTLPGKILGKNTDEPGCGYTLGLGYTRHVSKHWHVCIGLRYNTWNSISKKGPLIYEDDLLGNGATNPDPRYIITRHSYSGGQLMAGAGWHSKPKKWRWNVDAEVGMTALIKKPGIAGHVSRLTTGFSFGPEWRISRHFYLFAEPGGRFIFQKFNADGFAGYRFLSLQLETGGRYIF